MRFVIACECTYLVQALGILWFLRAKCIFWRMPSWRSDWYVPPFPLMSITAVTFDVMNGNLVSQRLYEAGGKLDPDIALGVYSGIFLVDSFLMVRGDLYWPEYVAEILIAVYKATGMRCLALVCAGAAMYNQSYHRLLFVALNNFKYKPRFLIIMCMGNDLYPLSKYCGAPMKRDA